jgi:hypothetical protein
MPDFTVIDGDSDPNYVHRQTAQYHFEEFAIALLRSIVAGGLSNNLVEQLAAFAKTSAEHDIVIAAVIDKAVRNLHSRAFSDIARDDFQIEIETIVQASLGVAAEMMAVDTAARARLSKREDRLTHALEEGLLSQERRARRNGWSYLKEMTRRIDKELRQEKKPIRL